MKSWWEISLNRTLHIFDLKQNSWVGYIWSRPGRFVLVKSVYSYFKKGFGVHCVAHTQHELKDARLILKLLYEIWVDSLSYTSVIWVESRHQDLFNCQPARDPLSLHRIDRKQTLARLTGISASVFDEKLSGCEVDLYYSGKAVLPWHRWSEKFLFSS